MLATMVSYKYLLNNILLKLRSLCCCSSSHIWLHEDSQIKRPDGYKMSGKAVTKE